MSLLIYQEDYLNSVGKNWLWMLLWGLALMVLGFAAIGASAFTTLLTIIIIGIVVLIGGAIIFINTLTSWRAHWGSFFIHLIMGILYMLVGYMLITDPVAGSISLTLLLGLFYIVIGIFRLAISSSHRLPQWGWGFFSGLIALILGFLILANWPAVSTFIIGLFIGIDLVFSGWSYVMLAFATKRFAK